MIDIIWLVCCLILGVPMITSPKKVAERPKCKIKSEITIRILGIIVVLAGVISILF